MGKTALITGITGQDGSYLAEFLLKKGYEVHGIKRRSSSFNTERIDHIFEDPHVKDPSLFLHYGDLTDYTNVIRLLNEIKPDEIYNLGAQSHVAVSFEVPEYTADVVALGSLRILEAIRILKLEKKCKYYQASSSELFGKVQEVPQNESTPFYPRSPYAISKLFAYWITINYRESYDIFACNGILFNHESPRRGETFVSRKITRGLSRVSVGLEECIHLGNLDAKRDWGHAKDYVEMQWLMLQQKKPKDYVIASGKQYSVRDFIKWTCSDLGLKIKFIGKGMNEKVVVEKVFSKKPLSIKKGDVIVKVDKSYFRPSEVENLLGDAKKASKDLGWKPIISSRNLCKEMVQEDLNKALKEIGSDTFQDNVLKKK